MTELTWPSVFSALSAAIAATPHRVPVTSVTLQATADGLMDDDEANKIPPYTCTIMYVTSKGPDAVLRITGASVPPKASIELRGIPASAHENDRFKAYIKARQVALAAVAPALVKDRILSFQVGAFSAATAPALDLRTDTNAAKAAATAVKGLDLDNGRLAAGGLGQPMLANESPSRVEGDNNDAARVRNPGTVATYQSMLTCLCHVIDAQVDALSDDPPLKQHRAEAEDRKGGGSTATSSPDDERWRANVRHVPAALAMPITTGLFGTRFMKGRKLGEGTFGEVCAAFDKATERWVVLKVMRRAEHSNGGLHNTITREIVAMKSLTHKNLLPLLDVLFQPHGSVVLVFELVPHDLHGLCRHSPILGDPVLLGVKAKDHETRIAAVKCVVLQLLQALQFLHTQGAWHRDVKQSNVLVHSDGTVVLCDFGWTRLVSVTSLEGGNAVNMTWPPCALNYRPLEIWCGRRAYDGAAIDMYGLGCMVFEMLARRPLFEGSVDVDIVRNIIQIAGAPDESESFLHTELVKELRKKAPIPSGVAARCTDFHVDLEASSFIAMLTRSDPKERLTAKEAAEHKWLHVQPFPLTPAAFGSMLPAKNCYGWVMSKK